MNWDISIGNSRRFYGRLLQTLGQLLDRRAMVLKGEQVEYRGRLQTRYGVLKHQEQWGATLVRIAREPQVAHAVEERIK